METLSHTQKIEELEELVALQNQQIAELKKLMKWYEEQLLLSKKRQYGSSSEKTNSKQLSLFGEDDFLTDPDLDEEPMETITYQRKKKGNSNKIHRLEDLPLEVIEYRLEEGERECPSCHGSLHEMSTQVRQVLPIIPAKVKLIKHVQ